jgi:hypothetical protein
MPEYVDTIHALLSLDLSTCPKEEIIRLIRQFGSFGLIQLTLHPGKSIIRARPMGPSEHFRSRAELSYKPASANKTYQRASTPDQTMFYGAVIPEDLPDDEKVNARIVASLETARLLRTPGLDGEQRMTFSRWIVTKDIPLVAICYHQDFVTKSSHSKELYEAYHRSMAGVMIRDPVLAQRSTAITEFLAAQYAKKVVDHDYEYMISALFSSITVARGQAGIYYPSIRADAKGFNVAIAPDYVDQGLRLVAAGECTIYKRGDQTIGDNDTSCEIDDDSLPFDYKPVSPEYHMGREEVLAEFARRPTTAP